MSVLNIERIMAYIEAAEVDALEEVASAIVADARARAPIRKVFKESAGFRRKFRPLTNQERSLAVKRALAYPGYTPAQRAYSVGHLRGHYGGVQGQPVRAEVRRRGSANALARSRTLRNLGTERAVKMRSGGGSVRVFHPRVDAKRVKSGYVSPSLEPLLSSRGKYEVRNGRAIHREVLASGNVRVQIGGKLKASIESEGVISTGQGSTVKVTAGVRYAKFVEFPTTHNAAQPFLLPALHDNRGKLKKILQQQLRQKLGGRG